LRIAPRHFLIISVAILAWSATPARAQSILDYPISARVTSMGETGVADNSTPSTIVLNPANVIGPLRLYAAGALLSTDIDNEDFWIRRANAGATWRLGPILFGVDLAYARLHLAPAHFFFEPSPVFTQDVVELTTGLGLAVGSNDFLFGLSAKRFADKAEAEQTPIPLDSVAVITSDNADAYAVDAGVEIHHRGSLQGWDVNSALGAAVTNVGNDIELESESQHLPRHVSGGVSVRMVSPPVQVLWGSVPLIAFSANIDATRPRDQDWEWMAGTELAVWQILFLRTGLHTVTGVDGPDPSQATWGAGVGVPLRNLRARLDYGRVADTGGRFQRFELTVERTF
jgi:hypothetical protein